MKKILFTCLALCLAFSAFGQVKTKYIKNRHTGRMDAIPMWQNDSLTFDISTMAGQTDTLNFPVVYDTLIGYSGVIEVYYPSTTVDDMTLTIQENSIDSLYISASSSVFPVTLIEYTGYPVPRSQKYVMPIVLPFQRAILNKGTGALGTVILVRKIKLI